MIRVPVNPTMIRWARERAGRSREELSARFEKLSEWESGETKPTPRQVETFARAVHVPEGYLFLREPPKEEVPIQDFRTLTGRPVIRPSPDLLETIYVCQDRQDWYRDFTRREGASDLGFVGSSTVEAPADLVAAQMRKTLDFSVNARKDCRTWSDALRLFIDRTEDAGILVMTSGIVMSNTNRSLDPGEFRGFALSDPVAPVVFVNGADTKAAQMFTLAHELAHIWLGASALSNVGAAPRRGLRREEVWCNAVAAEFLAPLAAVRSSLRDEPLPKALHRLARMFKVSTLVILRRLLDANWLTRGRFEDAWRKEVERLDAQAKANMGGGGDFCRATLARVSRRFARALIANTLEGDTLYLDALRMLGVSNVKTFNRIAKEVGAT